MWRTSVKQDLTRHIRTKAIELGFSKVGVARAEILKEDGGHLQEWLNRGYHASMAWMQKNAEKRIDVSKVLPEAKSVVCVVLNYYSDTEHSDAPGTGKISRYAWGDDYHLVLTNRLEILLNDIKSVQPGINGKVYVDTGPVMDKVWAARAGLGWQGKHTNLITKDFGSWVFLGEILLDVELEYDEPIMDACGTCTACIDACPTQAIVEPYVLDSNKCISYLTIEQRGPIPKNLSKDFEGWIYGCDICQDVCPWNRFQQTTNEKVFEPRTWNRVPELQEIENLTKEEFNDRFRKSPIKRTKREGLIRNVKAVSERSMNPS
jgi:epoxyqueuosine reductase